MIDAYNLMIEYYTLYWTIILSIKQMTDDQIYMKPLYHYTYKEEAVILDQQYNYQGNILAVSNSNGQIIFYSSENQENCREPIFTNDKKKTNQKKNAILKIAWSLPIFGLFASASISRQIDLYTYNKSFLNQILCKKVDYIPLSMAFCPIETQLLLLVGLSDGSIIMLNDKLQQLAMALGHDEGVNSLAWEHKLLNFQKNRWIMDNFSNIKNMNGVQQQTSLLLMTGSSDSYIKLWKWESQKLTELCKTKAHQKAVRQVHWKPVYLLDSDKLIVTCSQDGTVKIWKIKIEKGYSIELKQSKDFKGPVYRANFNFLGNMMAISYCNQAQERVQSIIMRQTKVLMGQKVNFG